MSASPAASGRVSQVVREGIAWLTLDRPQAGNAVDLAMAQALLHAASTCDADASIDCVVLTGAGKTFCVGGDLQAFLAEEVQTSISELVGVLHLAVSRFARMSKPLVVLVNGAAAGAGLSLALLGDVVLASSAASFIPAYGKLGVSPDGGLSWLLPRLVGLRRAQQILLTGRSLTATDAEAIGLITSVVEAHDLDAAGWRTARDLAKAATAAVAATRELLLSSLCSPFEAHLDAEARAIVRLGGAEDAQEGVRAFLERRAPDFKGAAHG